MNVFRRLLAPSIVSLLSLGVLATPSEAQYNACSASALFSSCSVTCPWDQRPVCYSNPLWASCTCEKWGTIDATRGWVRVDDAQHASLMSFFDSTAGFESIPGQALRAASSQAFDAVLAKDTVAYWKAVRAFNDAVKLLPADERKIYDEFVAKRD